MKKKTFNEIVSPINKEIEEIIAPVNREIKELNKDIGEMMAPVNKELEVIAQRALEYKRYAWFFPIYVLAYIILERAPFVHSYNIIHCFLDDWIPFCEFFVVPYFLWHIGIAVLSIYSFRYDAKRFERLLRYFILCSLIILVIYLLFPSAQNMRPTSFERDNIFVDLVRFIYVVDTPTNICPSMHVVGQLGLLFAAWDIKPLNKPVHHTWMILESAAVCLSTVLLKQHSAIDVIAAIPLSIIGWWACFGDEDNFKGTDFSDVLSKVFARGKILTIPNILSLFRLALVPSIISVFTIDEDYIKVVILIALSGFTDVADGFIARRFNMISDLGKILDPIADKSTQIAIMYCLAVKYPPIWSVVIVTIAKELTQAAFGFISINKTNEIPVSKWYGKLNTALLYTFALILILFPAAPSFVSILMVVCCLTTSILSIIGYTRFYIGTLYVEKEGAIHKRAKRFVLIFAALGFLILTLFLLTQR